mmetsp:Transcript_29085/g.70951  ORF Transcript_29085/g.70951 Transcript_29085/m.70951 type:complete len:368 (+) Transcript_29085:188-1291(+)
MTSKKHARSAHSSSTDNGVISRVSKTDDGTSPSDEDRPVPPFLVKTYKMVQDKKTNDIISWTDKGDAFVVKKQHEFSQNVLPQYFRTNCFSSFVRQLNFYGFRKRSTNMSTTAHFKHKHFKKDQFDKLHLIKKKTSESSSTLKQSVVDLQKEVSQLKDQYKEIRNVQHQILMMLANFAPRYNPSFPQLRSPRQPFMPNQLPPGGIGPMRTPPNPVGGMDVNSLLMSHYTANNDPPMLAQITAGGNNAATANSTPTNGWSQQPAATIQDVTEADVDAGSKRPAASELKTNESVSKRTRPNPLMLPSLSPHIADGSSDPVDEILPGTRIVETPPLGGGGHHIGNEDLNLPSPLFSLTDPSPDDLLADGT